MKFEYSKYHNRTRRTYIGKYHKYILDGNNGSYILHTKAHKTHKNLPQYIRRSGIFNTIAKAVKKIEDMEKDRWATQ